MNPRNSIWFRLAALARLAPSDASDEAAPPGFATRVAALAFAVAEPSLSAVLARLSWRALTVAAVVMLVTAAANFSPLLASFSQDRDVATVLSDPVGEWLNLS
ncbi:MAG TPA: hypothetical protein VL357_02360 [Rariglobus sp.]|jgi:hypothetical protein|nr:hypothetical protein [Rariglobus sp.]